MRPGKLTITYDKTEVPFTRLASRLGRQRSAMHDPEAVLIISGTGIRKGIELQDAELVDFAPTILQASGLKIPSTFQGKVLDIFE